MDSSLKNAALIALILLLAGCGGSLQTVQTLDVHYVVGHDAPQRTVGSMALVLTRHDGEPAHEVLRFWSTQPDLNKTPPPACGAAPNPDVCTLRVVVPSGNDRFELDSFDDSIGIGKPYSIVPFAVTMDRPRWVQVTIPKSAVPKAALSVVLTITPPTHNVTLQPFHSMALYLLGADGISMHRRLRVWSYLDKPWMSFDGADWHCAGPAERGNAWNVCRTIVKVPTRRYDLLPPQARSIWGTQPYYYEFAFYDSENATGKARIEEYDQDRFIHGLRTLGVGGPADYLFGSVRK
jgi:hypothetical protein